MSVVETFLTKVQAIYKTGAATEHSYRSAIESLFVSLNEGVIALNEPKRVQCGAPDFIISRGEIVIGHVEAKDIDKDLSTLKGAEANQKTRYLKALPNLIYTNCLDFEFYREGVLLTKICIADYLMGIQPKPEEFESLENLLRDFTAQKPQTITSSEKLAEIMAGKAVLIKDVLFNALREDEELQTEIAGQYKAFQEHLIHDITAEDFADIYAETIAYGMFAARLHDETLDTFSRQEALDLLPKTNPFLRSLFGYIAGHDLDERIRWIIDDLADVFQASNVKKLMENFGSLTGRNDPFLHFYETFLAKYNPAKRKARGVWYTPEPVVNFIVRAVDEVLQEEFGLAAGLADTSKVTIDWDTGQADKKGKPVTIKKEVHRVQILDPATGTGTFLAEVIKQIAPKVKGVAEGMWSSYIEKDLIPRLHGFELLMASYAMCHMKLDMILNELGYKPSEAPPRLEVYLTNSLEEGEREVSDLFMAQWLTREAKEANNVKRQQPIMCVIGNPPYSGISQNMGEWIVNLIEDYKYVDGVHFGERKHSLHDDYVKFIRFSERLIEKNGEGILGFITNHGYLDNPTFRGMRWHLLQTFDEIKIIDIHGNSKRGENPPAGVRDKNIFDIQQGVSIIIAIKKSDQLEKEIAKVQHADLWGSRAKKYNDLFSKRFTEFAPQHCVPKAPYFTLNGKNVLNEDYESGFSILDFMKVATTGIQTSRDPVALAENADELRKKIVEVCNPNIDTDVIRKKYFSKTSKNYPAGDTRDWKLESQRKKIDANGIDKYIVPYAFRPLDNRLIALHPELISWPRTDVSKHMMKDNISLITARSNKTGVNHFYCSRFVSDVKCGESSTGSIFAPVYLYPDEQDLDQNRRINFDEKIWKKLQKLAKHPKHGIPDEINSFDYIYGVLHCPAFRNAYADLLRINFPRIPWPSSPAEFWDIAGKGAQLRRLHLMEPAAIGQAPFPFKGDGSAEVGKPRFEDCKVWINDMQFFDGVPIIAWEFFIGGYQPAQKWLKDRKGRELSFDDVVHYQRIIKILSETDRIMKTIKMEL